MGPAALRTAGIVESLRELGHEVVDQGDLPAPAPVQLHLPHSARPDLAGPMRRAGRAREVDMGLRSGRS